MRFGYVTDQIAIGGAINSKETYNQMQHYLGGITHIICLTRLCEHRFDDDPYPEILHYYFYDDGEWKPYRYWAVHVEFALDALRDPDAKLLIHCAAGRNRSTSIAYAILLCLNYSRDQARKMILDKYAKKMYEQEKHLKNSGAYKPLYDIRYKENVDYFHTAWLHKCDNEQ